MSRENYEITCPECGKAGIATFYEDESGNAYWGRGQDSWSVKKDSGFFIQPGERCHDYETNSYYQMDNTVCCSACKIPVRTGARKDRQ